MGLSGADAPEEAAEGSGPDVLVIEFLLIAVDQYWPHVQM